MADLRNIHPKSVNAYDDLVGYVFQGRYMGVEQNKSSGTMRSVFQVDSDAGNDELLNLFSRIRRWNSKSYGEVNLTQIPHLHIHTTHNVCNWIVFVFEKVMLSQAPFFQFKVRVWHCQRTMFMHGYFGLVYIYANAKAKRKFTLVPSFLFLDVNGQFLRTHFEAKSRLFYVSVNRPLA